MNWKWQKSQICLKLKRHSHSASDLTWQQACGNLWLNIAWFSLHLLLWFVDKASFILCSLDFCSFVLISRTNRKGPTWQHPHRWWIITAGTEKREISLYLLTVYKCWSSLPLCFCSVFVSLFLLNELLEAEGGRVWRPLIILTPDLISMCLVSWILWATTTLTTRTNI